MHAPARPTTGLQDRDDTDQLSDEQLAARARRCQQEQERRYAAAKAASGGGIEPLRKDG